MREILSSLVVLLLAAMPAVAAPATANPPPIAAGPVELAAHHAVYELTLGSGRGGVVAATGRMTYDVIDACSAWAVQQRLELAVADNDGTVSRSVSDYTTWESKDGRTLRYRLHETTDGQTSTDIAGEAHLDRPGGPGVAVYTKPKPARVALPAGTMFPMAQNRVIIAAAQAGQRVISMPLFDGTDADGAQDSTVALANWGTASGTSWPALKELASGRMHIGFFARGTTGKEPDMQIGSRYFSNGVADGITMDFGDFLMDGRLVTFELRPSRC
jgi:hypothetical protein